MEENSIYFAICNFELGVLKLKKIVGRQGAIHYGFKNYIFQIVLNSKLKINLSSKIF